MNDTKDKAKQLLCLDERQTTWCISLVVMLIGVVIIVAYIAGYRTAMRTIINDTKKDSFNDQLYTSFTSMHLGDQALSENKKGYYIQCKIADKTVAKGLVDLMQKEGLPLHLLEEWKSTDNQQVAESCQYLVSPVMDTEEEAIAFAASLKNKTNMCDAAIITTQKAQKLKGFNYDYSIT